MNFVYVLESYDWDGIDVVGVFEEEIPAVKEATDLSEILIARICSEYKDIMEQILSNEGYFVRKVPLNVIYPEKEIIFDSYDYWTDKNEEV